MTDPSANTLWARAFADEVARSGVREVVVAPGSRSTPLVMAFARDGRFTMRVHLDERSAAFFALGVGKATGRPAVVITTSGTAAANVFPAVVEASRSGVPLLVLTADRPHRLRDADANQAIDQIHIYGRYPRAFFEVAPPALDARGLLHLRGLADRAVAATVGPQGGPVHVNFPFDKPLEPIDPPDTFVREHPLAALGRADGLPSVRIDEGALSLDDGALEALFARSDARRGVIVAGPCENAAGHAPTLLRFATAAGLPLLADPLSGARYGDPEGTLVVAGYDVFLRDAEVRARLEPSLVIRVGSSPTSASLQRWLLQHAGAEQVVIDDGTRWKDHGTTATRYVRADPADTLRRLADLWGQGTDTGTRSPGADDRDDAGTAPAVDPEWLTSWRRASEAAAGSSGTGTALHEGHAVRAAHSALPAGGTLFISSSMPIRDLDSFVHPSPKAVRVYCNRGASGIDGVVSSAFGAASQAEGSAVCVIGDVAFFHDQNGLLWSREADAAVVFVLLDNDGGGIFHMLPIVEHEPDFTRFFATPHGVDADRMAAAFGITLTDVSIGDVGPEVERALSRNETTILRVRTERAAQQALRAEAFERITRSVRAALG